MILVGTGAGGYIALETNRQVSTQDLQVRMISLPSWELFDRQPTQYRESKVPYAVCAGNYRGCAPLGWER